MAIQHAEMGDGGGTSSYEGPAEHNGPAEHENNESPGNNIGNFSDEGKIAGIQLYDPKSYDFTNPRQDVERLIDRYLERARESFPGGSVHDIYELAFNYSANDRKLNPLNETLRNTEYYLMCSSARQGDTIIDHIMVASCIGTPMYEGLKLVENSLNWVLNKIGAGSVNIMSTDKSLPTSKPGGWFDAWRGLYDGGTRSSPVHPTYRTDDSPPQINLPGG